VIVVDTSVVVAAFASWHSLHVDADRIIGGGARLVAHCALEAYSVLTRLPAPHRAPAHLVGEFLSARFAERYVGLDAEEYRALIPRLVELGSPVARRTTRWSRRQLAPPTPCSSAAIAARLRHTSASGPTSACWAERSPSSSL
jgi:hypothetical protein